MLKRILSLVIAGLMVLSVAGCGKDSSSSSNEIGDSFAAKSEITLPKFSIDPTSRYVTLLTWDDPSNLTNPSAWSYNLNQKLLKEYGCELKYIRTTFNDVPTKAAQMVLSGNSPDLIIFRERDKPNFILNGLVQSVDEYIDFNEPLFKDLKEVNDANRVNGKIYNFITNYINNGLTYWWTKDLEDLGLENPRSLYYKGEWTWSKLEEYAKLLTKTSSDGTVSRYGTAFEANMHVVTGETYVKSTNGTYTNNLRSSKLANFFNYASRLGFEEKVRPVGGTSFELFEQHKVSMLVFERYWLDNHMADQFLSGEVDFAPLPRWEGADKYYAPGRVTTMWVAKGAPNLGGVLAYYAIWHLCNGGIDANVQEALNKLNHSLKGLDDEDNALLDEMQDPEKFELIYTLDDGFGTNWSATERVNFQKQVMDYNKPWATAIEEYSPLLDAGIKEAVNKLNAMN